MAAYAEFRSAADAAAHIDSTAGITRQIHHARALAVLSCAFPDMQLHFLARHTRCRTSHFTMAWRSTRRRHARKSAAMMARAASAWPAAMAGLRCDDEGAPRRAGRWRHADGAPLARPRRRRNSGDDAPACALRLASFSGGRDGGDRYCRALHYAEDARRISKMRLIGRYRPPSNYADAGRAGMRRQCRHDDDAREPPAPSPMKWRQHFRSHLPGARYLRTAAH